LKGAVDILKAAAHHNGYDEGDHCGPDHQGALDHVRHHGSLHTAGHTVNNNNGSHTGNAHPVGKPGKYIDDHACADDLGSHHRNQEEQHHHAQDAAHCLSVIPVCKIICHSQKTMSVSQSDQF